MSLSVLGPRISQLLTLCLSPRTAQGKEVASSHFPLQALGPVLTLPPSMVIYPMAQTSGFVLSNPETGYSVAAVRWGRRDVLPWPALSKPGFRVAVGS